MIADPELKTNNPLIDANRSGPKSLVACRIVLELLPKH